MNKNFDFDWQKPSGPKKSNYSKESGPLPFRKQFSSGNYSGSYRGYGYKGSYYKNRNYEGSNRSEYNTSSIRTVSELFKVLLTCESKFEGDKVTLQRSSSEKFDGQKE